MTAVPVPFAGVRPAHGFPSYEAARRDVFAAAFVDDVTCTDCRDTRLDAASRRCEGCGVTGCECVVIPTRNLCDRWSGGDLCEDCAATYTCNGRCPDCDPPDPRDF